MKIDLSDFRKAFDNLLTDIKTIYQERVSAAEEAKEMINEQVEVLNEVSDDMFDIAELMSDFVAIFEENVDTFDDFGTRVSDVAQGLIDAGIPKGNIGTFVGFCSVCGEELHIEDKAYICPDNERLVCANCHSDDEADEADDDEDDEPKFGGAQIPVDND